MNALIFFVAVCVPQDAPPPGDFFGVEPAAIGATDDEIEATLKLVEASGVGWISLRLAWGDYDAAPDAFDKLLARCKTHKLRPIVTLRLRPYTIGLDATKPNVKTIEMLRAWAGKLAERFDGDKTDDAPDAAAVHHWVIERDASQIPGATMKARVETLSTLSSAIQKADRDAFVMVGVAATDEGAGNFTRFVAEGASEFFHAVLVYVLTEPARADEPLRDIEKALKDSGYVRPMWAMTGEPASGAKRTERTQASEAIKRSLFLFDRGAEKVFWYPLADVKSDADEPCPTKCDSGGGLLTDAAKERPAYAVLKRFVALFEHSPVVKKMDEPGHPKEVTVYQIVRTGGRNCYVAWAKTTKTLKNQLVLGTNADAVTATDLDGKDVAPGATKKKEALFDLIDEPLVIVQK